MKDVTEKIIQALEAESFPTHENHSAVWLDTAIAAVGKVIKSYKEENEKIHNRAVREHQAKYEAIKRAETICEWTYQDKFYLHKTSCGNEDTYDDSYRFCPYCGRKIEIMHDDIEIVEDHWIPCSERLPNGSELWLGKDITDAEPRQFIVMVKGTDEPTTGYYTANGWVQDIYNKDNKNSYANEIVAWRFFPEPYKEV